MRWLGYWLLALCKRWRLFRVSGNSMVPTLDPGDWVWVDPNAYRTGQGPGPNQIIVARHPYRTDVWLIKRVRETSDDGHLTLSGDNPAESTDSATFGKLPANLVLGRVTLHYRWHSGRANWLNR